MNTTIQPGNFRVSTFSAVKNFDNSPIAAFDSPVAVVFDSPGIVAFAPVADATNGLGDFVALAAGTTNFTATGTVGGKTATVTGNVVVAKADDGTFTMAVAFGDEQVTPSA